MEIDNKVLQELIKDVKTEADLNDILKALRKRGLEAALAGELTDHLGYDKHKRSQARKPNTRNGYHAKTLQSASGTIDLEIPRDRDGSFTPQIVKPYQSRIDRFDEKVIALYARGLSTRDIQSELSELYGDDISPTLISNVTNAVLEDVKVWQSRGLDSLYPIIYLDCLVVKVREEKSVMKKAVYLALGVNAEGQKELLGMWISRNEGAKFWLNVLTELKNRGLSRVFIFCVDGLSGFPEAIETVYSEAKVQLCIVHKIRQSLKYVSWKDRKALAGDLRAVYGAKTVEEAELALETFSGKWDRQYPTIRPSWERDWERLIPFFNYPMDIRKAIYTTNAIESLNMTLRKVIKNKRVFPSDESVYKILYSAIERISKKWTMPIHHWSGAMNRFMIEFDYQETE